MAANKTTADIIFEAHNAGAVGDAAVVAAITAIVAGEIPDAQTAADVAVEAPATDVTWVDVQTALDDIAARLALLEV